MNLINNLINKAKAFSLQDSHPDTLEIPSKEYINESDIEKWSKTSIPSSDEKLTVSVNAPIITKYLTTKNFTKVNRSDSAISYIVIHYTSNKNDTARANASYFYSAYRGASAHYFVDQTSIYQSVLDCDVAWHCGTTGTYYTACRNTSSIGVEMCTTYVNGTYSIDSATEVKTIELVKYLMAKYHIDVTHVIRHYDVTHKLCPLPWVNDPTLWTNFKTKLASLSTQNTVMADRQSSYIQADSDLHIVKIPVSAFKIQYWDKPKKTTEIRNYFNCGYFANFSENGTTFTLPVANIICDIYEDQVSPVALGYLSQRGVIRNHKLYIHSSNNGTQFGTNKVSTLFLYQNGMVQIEATNFVPDDANYAISGAPVMMDGQDISWNKVVIKQGWDASIAHATWHSFLGLTGDGYIYYIAFKSTSDNLFTTSEAYKRLNPLGFKDVIKVDGGGSFIFDLDGTNRAVTDENRQINNVGRCL